MAALSTKYYPINYEEKNLKIPVKEDLCCIRTNLSRVQRKWKCIRELENRYRSFANFVISEGSITYVEFIRNVSLD